ncbi:hypothetical protein D3C77_582150 [compost metagenome]
MEELLLRALLLGEELDIVDQQRIDRTIETLEFIDRVELQGLDHIRDEALRMQVHHLGIGVFLQQVIAHRMHQVSLAEADTAVEKERVVAMLGIVRHLPGRRQAQPSAAVQPPRKAAQQVRCACYQ